MRPPIGGSGTWIAVIVLSLLIPGGARGQTQGEFIGTVGGGITLYGIDTRFDDGVLLRGGLGYTLTRHLMVEGGARWHGCFDCDRFLILEGGLQLRYPANRLIPFVSMGVGRASDSGFMGVGWGLHLATGSWIELSEAWWLQFEARGRQVGVDSSDYMGEFSVGVTRRLPGRGS